MQSTEKNARNPKIASKTPNNNKKHKQNTPKPKNKIDTAKNKKTNKQTKQKQNQNKTKKQHKQKKRPPQGGERAAVQNLLGGIAVGDLATLADGCMVQRVTDAVHASAAVGGAWLDVSVVPP